MFNKLSRLTRAIATHGLLGTLKISLPLMRRTLVGTPDAVRFWWIRLRSTSSVAIVETQVGQMYVDLNDQGIGKKLALSGVHEEASSKQLQKELTSGMNVLEVGANIGYYVKLVANEIGPTGRILAFEPSRINVEMLKKNVELSSLEDIVHIEHSAVGEESGEAELFMMDKANTSSLVQRKDGALTQIASEIVPVVSIDDYLKDRDFEFDWFRMDVEGYEFEIVGGMKQSIANSDPKGCFIEVHSSLFPELGHTTLEFMELMNSVGFELNIGRWRGRNDIEVRNDDEWKVHPRFETGYWEVFFKRSESD